MPRLHALAAGLGAFGALLLPMHSHPSGSTDRVTPGAVRVEASSHVSITLLDDRGVLKQIVREYDADTTEGSGFTVTPDGVVVTATQVVRTDRDPRVYAANRVFAEYFKVEIPADFARHSLDDPDLNRRLQACYPPQKSDSTCIATVTTTVTVFPYLDPPIPGGLPARILTTGATPAAPAVLKVTEGGERQTLPTVPLGTALGGAVESLDVMTLTGRPSAKLPPQLDTAHLDPPGGRAFKRSERDKLARLLKNGAAGAALIDDGKSEVIGLLAGGGDLPATITPAEDIRTSLVAAGVTPRRGPIDVVYENALAFYHNKSYTSAIPVLQQVLNLRADHAVALDHLRTARTKAGTAEDASGRPRPSAAPARETPTVPPVVWATGGAVVVALLIAGAVPLWRHRRAAAGAPAADPAWPHTPTRLIEGPRPAEARTTAEVSPPGGTSQPGFAAPPPPGPSQGAPQGPLGGRRPGDGSPPHGLPQPSFCTQCGMRLGPGHRFCGFCGTPVES